LLARSIRSFSTGDGVPTRACWISEALPAALSIDRRPSTVSGKLITVEIQVGTPAYKVSAPTT